MKLRRIAILAIALGVWGFAAGSAHAQTWQPGGYRPPPVRPQAPSGAFSRPPMDASRLFNPIDPNLTSSFGSTIQGMPAQPLDPRMPLQTGHPTAYFNYRNYFPLAYGSTGSGVAGGTGFTPSLMSPTGMQTGAIGASGFTPVYSNVPGLFQRRQ